MEDLWTWCALYKNGRTFTEFDRKGNERSFREVPPEKVDVMLLLPRSSEQRAYSMKIEAGASPVCFRRRSIHMQGDGSEAGRSVIHCIGWQTDEAASYLFVFEDGHTLLTDDLNAV